jgi:predicted RNase H-like HicB family nuclease
MTLSAADYVPRVLGQTGIPDRPSGDFQPDSLVGIASDGRRLDTLTYGAVTEAKTAVSEGATTQQALDRGGNWLDLMTKLQVADAARQAVGVLTASRKNLGGTVRVLNPPSCQRCAILAGRFYRWSKGFDRHPRCDCVNTPVPSKAYAEAEGFITDPMDAYRAGEIHDLTNAQVKAIDEGADIGQVVNAYRGISTTATQTRLRPSNITRGAVEPGMPDLLSGILGARASVGRVERARVLTPEGIYQQAKSRDEAISLLREHGYITT